MDLWVLVLSVRRSKPKDDLIALTETFRFIFLHGVHKTIGSGFVAKGGFLQPKIEIKPNALLSPELFLQLASTDLVGLDISLLTNLI